MRVQDVDKAWNDWQDFATAATAISVDQVDITPRAGEEVGEAIRLFRHFIGISDDAYDQFNLTCAAHLPPECDAGTAASIGFMVGALAANHAGSVDKASDVDRASGVCPFRAASPDVGKALGSLRA